MASLRKPVVVRLLSGEWYAGYADAEPDGGAAMLEVLDPAGSLKSRLWNEIRWVCFVRDIAGPDPANPERILQKRFTVRPRTPGLWLRVELLDGEVIEGIAANNRTLLDGAGVTLTPPDLRGNTQRIFVPRGSIRAMEVISVIGLAARKAETLKDSQPKLFGEE